jgi:predicted HNH restriction endonuclease
MKGHNKSVVEDESGPKENFSKTNTYQLIKDALLTMEGVEWTTDNKSYKTALSTFFKNATEKFPGASYFRRKNKREKQSQEAKAAQKREQRVNVGRIKEATKRRLLSKMQAEKVDSGDKTIVNDTNGSSESQPSTSGTQV